MSVTLPDPDAPLCPTIRGEANMPDMVMDAGDGTQRVIESDAIRALVGYVEQRDGHHRGLDAADDEQDEAPPPVSADTIIAMAAELPPRTFRVWLDAHDG